MTIRTGEEFIKQPPLKTDVCIVGTGPAGITLAWHLKKKHPELDVTLLEGSRLFGRAPDSTFGNGTTNGQTYEWNENTALYNGATEGLMKQNEEEFLVRPSPTFNSGPWERERLYGGTSTHWGAQSRPLDPITFKKRPGFSGWPIMREDLDDYYDRACRFCQLYGDYYVKGKEPGYNFTAEFWSQQLGQSVPELEGFDVDMYQFFNDHQFQARLLDGQSTIGDSDVRVILNASLLDMAKENNTVSTLAVGVMQGDKNTTPSKLGEFSINAQVVVLACGAVANARQLLLSGFGDTNDNIGAYFMCHPIATKAPGFNAVSVFPSMEQGVLGFRNENRFFNIYALKGVYTPNERTATKLETGRCWLDNNGSRDFYHEMLPWKESRVSLADSKDPVFGQRQTQIDWQLNPDSERNYNSLTQFYKTSVKQNNPSATVNIQPWADVEKNMVVNGHHLGTTRMGWSEKDGVVDRNLKVFGTDNLYVAGSSIWATAGISNPTFSIITFSIRLADHIGENCCK